MCFAYIICFPPLRQYIQYNLSPIPVAYLGISFLRAARLFEQLYNDTPSLKSRYIECCIKMFSITEGKYPGRW